MISRFPFLLSSGEMMYYDAPVYPITIEDVAHGLANTNRCKGQAPRLWTIAAHSVFVYHIIKTRHPEDYELQLHALLHDCEEGITADIPTGCKSYLDARCYRLKSELEWVRQRIITALFKKAHLSMPALPTDAQQDLIGGADVQAFVTEIHTQPKSKYKSRMLNYVEEKYPGTPGNMCLPPEIEFYAGVDGLRAHCPTHKFIQIFTNLVIKLGGTI